MLLLLFGCSDQNLNKLSDAEMGAAPLIEVSPPILHFGEYTGTPVVRNLTISNEGEATLDVRSIVIQGNDAISFTNQTGLSQFFIEPYDSTVLPFIFEPQSVQNDAIVSISSNDIDTPIVEVPLSGTLTAPMVSVTPNPFDMGTHSLGCYGEHSLQISNTGTAPLTISDISSLSEDMSFISVDELPILLNPAETQTIEIGFIPSQTTPTQGTFDVTSNAINHPYSFIAQGSGFAPEHTQSWTIQEGPKSDILFSVDLSSSMSDEAVTLGQQFNTFITTLSNYTSDWQVMVVNADHGCNHSGILTPSTPNYETIFADAVRTGAYDISFTEALLTNVTRAVEKTDPGDCNEGFLRPNAQLHIIMLSDECEQSPNPGICGTQWQSYIDRIYNAKGDPHLVRLSAVAGDYPSGCGGTALFGSGYWESTQITGGVFLSICSDWTSPMALQMLANSSISQSRFTLDHPAMEESISVTVDGVAHVDWIFDGNSNEVIIQSNIPGSGRTISITYTEIPSCEQE